MPGTGRYRAPNGEGGKMRAVCIPDELWERTGVMAGALGVSRNEVVRRALRESDERTDSTGGGRTEGSR